MWSCLACAARVAGPCNGPRAFTRPSEPVADRIAGGDLVQAQYLAQPCIHAYLTKILQTAATAVKHQKKRFHKLRRLVSRAAFGAGKLAVDQARNAHGVHELAENSQPGVGGDPVLRNFELERKDRLCEHLFHLVGDWWIRS